MRLRHACLALLLAAAAPLAQAQDLTVARIMQDPDTWVGSWPSGVFFTDAGDYAYFRWNPGGQFPADSLYRVPVRGGTPELVTAAEAERLPPAFEGWSRARLSYSEDFSLRLFERDGDLYMYDRAGARTLRLTDTPERETNPLFDVTDEERIFFVRDGNVYALDADGDHAILRQLSDLREGEPEAEPDTSKADRYLYEQQARLFDFVREADDERRASEAAREAAEARRNRPSPFYLRGQRAGQLGIDPTGRYVTFTLSRPGGPPRFTEMTDYVTASGYAEPIRARPKVGTQAPTPATLYVQDLQRDTTYSVDLTGLPGFYSPPDYAAERGATADSTRTLVPYGPVWSRDGRYAVLDVRTTDNKDRWIVRLDAATGTATSLDHQRDEAWVAGPGIAWWGGGSPIGFMMDDRHVWYHSEATGYSHLYRTDVETGATEALTSGPFEVEVAYLSQSGEDWVMQTSEGSPHERHVWMMEDDGADRDQLTSGPGRWDFALSPDFDHVALVHSLSNRPPEVFVGATRSADEAVQVTRSTSEAWRAYPWREAEIITVPASDGVSVPARIYRPERPNGAAVLFVHGAGYLQNVHTWWSSYFREYMFHNLLADEGYLVLDLDYRGSAGYGRDWRTAIYRHMGGRDLQDYVDASEYVGREFGIDPERVAIYGGSYGGFITLMALFTEPEHFGGGAALRSVTDWAHYNHVYTSNILNEPAEDPEAYERSSPIEFAEGLEDPLLMAHGLIDDNVQPQDIFRLSQRLIELGKTDWELALYPVEPHGFQRPSSWTDEYRRILELIEATVGPNRTERQGVDPSEG